MYSGRKCWEPSVSVQEMAGQDDCTERGEAKEDQSEEGVHKAEKRRADAAGDEANDDNEHIPLIFGCFRKNRLFQHPRDITTTIGIAIAQAAYRIKSKFVVHCVGLFEPPHLGNFQERSARRKAPKETYGRGRIFSCS